MNNSDEFEVDRETDRTFMPGLGQSGQTTKLAPVQLAVNKYTELAMAAQYCPRCEYDRAKVTIKHNPEYPDTIEIRCHACQLDIEDQLSRKQKQLRAERETGEPV